jgi:hypothetical protein
LFLIATEPLSRLLASSFPELMYTSEEGVTVGPVLYADDNLTPLSLDTADQLGSIRDLYESYTGVSGLNININTSMALCINTPPALSEQLQSMGMTTPDTIKHLGLHLGKTISTMVTTTMSQIEPKAKNSSHHAPY